MSADTWRQEFYPCDPNPLMSRLAAIQHSLKKWQGLRTRSLLDHGIGSPPIMINGTSCSPCIKYRDDSGEYDEEASEESEFDGHPCVLCPLYGALGQRACDHDVECESEERAPFHVWREDNDPEPMIAALEKTLEEYHAAMKEIDKP